MSDFLEDSSYQALLDLLNQHKEIRTFYRKNYSFFEVLSKLHNDMAEGDIKHKVKIVCQAFLAHNSNKVGFCESVFDLTVFLLCFCSPCKAFAILC